ncbi:hypothetical protein J40TS1_41750 [Paenibacillus montaniterrae]|uniref:DUF1700 domain-containing protein n=1 Tax=Paenibacillus montaniterrae TaxID=429341 RepID=A0A920D0G7_9BACL|nr:DUF1700 domain-containing protein [Paenibacillus montaniterrae]GIP18533.1 hypothetical protein J40TS1_41750 [Paenibacillus montaniterrae]
MNKAQFLSILRKMLSSLPLKERNELLEDYEHHYAFGQNAGKTEEEISEELGNPHEIAAEVLAEYNRNQPLISSNSRSRSIMACIGLFMLNFVLCVVPLGLAIWAVWVCLVAGSALLILSPLVALFDFVYNSYFSSSKLFATIAMTGLGIMLAMGVFSLGARLKKVTVSYINWNMSIIRGGR